MYERRNEPPISASRFRLRVFGHVLAAFCLFLGSVLIGAVGFVLFEGMDWGRGTLNATTLISGLGVAEMPQAPGAKLFASLFALYSGFVFVAMSGIMIAPILHRLLHFFHWAGEGRQS